jgi:hypothetical protein
MPASKTDEPVVWATFTDGSRIARESDFPKGANPLALSSRPAMVTARGGRAFDAASPPASDPGREAARQRARERIARFRAARALDGQPAATRQPDYRALQAAVDAKRGVPAGFTGIAYNSEAERDFVRRRYRALHNMESASDQTVDRYLHLQGAIDSKRG